LPSGFRWLGTGRAPTLAELRGHVVVLDFWSYCRVQCLHLLPVLGELERKRKDDPLVVIGVHSGKFETERDPERIREAMLRHGVTHPVVVDEDHALWRRYAVRSWPTLVVIRPDGSIASVAPGEAELGALDAFVGGLLAEARAEGTLAAERLRLDALPHPAASAILSFPGKVIALADGRLVVSDTGHHRVMVLEGDGGVAAVIGSGEEGLRDGSLAESRFRSPQGLAAEGDFLFVADAGNHVLREVELRAGRVRTVAGTGDLGRGPLRGPAPARDVALRSPWDVAVAGDYLLVAMAGSHQIWAYHRELETLRVLAGTGREALADGAFHEAAFAQPSGLALVGPRVYVADSGASAVRFLDLVTGRVESLVGTGLFDFGDRDGPRGQALLQHPVGIACGPAGLLVADTLNDKVRRVDPETGLVSPLYGGAEGLALREPGGLCQLDDGRVIVADTNQHRLLAVTAAGGSASVVDVRFLEGRAAAAGVVAQQEIEGAVVGPGAITFRLELAPPAGWELAAGSWASLRLEATGPLAAPGRELGFEVAEGRHSADAVLRAGPGAGDAQLRVRVEAVVCGTASGACVPVGARYRLPVRIDPTRAHGAIERVAALPPPG
jgi:thiol-disulfide isomerase/thioredoxin